MNKIIGFVKKTLLKVEEFPILGAMFVFLTIFSFYAYAYFSTLGISAPDDHFFNFKYAYLLRTQDWSSIKSFDWIYLTQFSLEREGYPNSLFQIALIPFTLFENLITGLRVSDIFWGSLTFSIIYYAFRKLNIKKSLLFVMILLSSATFLHRELMGRSFVLSVGFIFLEIYFASEKKYRKFFLISLVHVFWHQSTFFMPLIIAILVEVARYLSSKRYFYFNIVGATLAAFAANLYFPNLFKGLILAARSALGGQARVQGAELYSIDIFGILQKSELFLLMILIGFAITIYLYLKNRNIENSTHQRELMLVYVAFLFSLMSLAGTIISSGRFFDYYFPSIVFLIGSISSYIIYSKDMLITKKITNYVFFGILAFVAIAGANSFIIIKNSIYNNDYLPTSKVAEWVGSVSNNKEHIFLNNWSSFPVAFFYNSKNVYSMGIEPTALQIYDAGLYWKWYNIHNYGIYCDQLMDCSEQNELFQTSLKEASDESKVTINRENSKKIIESIKRDFEANYIISNGQFSDMLKLNLDLIDDSFESVSELNGARMVGIKLK